MPLAQRVGNFVDVKRAFGNQDYIGASGHAAVKGDPTGIAAHDLDDHDAVVRFGSGMNAIYGFADDVAGGVESEGVLGATEIVINRLGHADDMNSVLMQLLRNRESVVAADRDQSIDLVLLERGDAAFD